MRQRNQERRPSQEHAVGMIRAFFLLFACSLPLSACSIHKMTGEVMTEYTVEHLSPHLLMSEDLEMACELGISMGPFILSFGQFWPDHEDSGGRMLDQAAVPTLATAALCSEEAAVEAELRSLRVLRGARAAESEAARLLVSERAQDARIVQKRAHARAARRYYAAYQRSARLYPEARCPEGEREELTLLFGLISGLQALQHDRASGVQVGVPENLPRLIERKSTCLDNQRWWGVPEALRGAVWSLIPGATPEGSDPWATLEAASATGEAAGVRIATSIAIHAAHAKGDAQSARLKALFQRLRASRAATTAPKRWRLLDELAVLLTRLLSDRIWTEATGHRTPKGQLGLLPPSPAEVAAEEDEGDLLEGL